MTPQQLHETTSEFFELLPKYRSKIKASVEKISTKNRNLTTKVRFSLQNAYFSRKFSTVCAHLWKKRGSQPVQFRLRAVLRRLHFVQSRPQVVQETQNHPSHFSMFFKLLYRYFLSNHTFIFVSSNFFGFSFFTENPLIDILRYLTDLAGIAPPRGLML